ncbi:RNA polymerase factor sigma-32 [Halobacteriovorax sp. HLS]|uniref:RNA polymerase factor sigma-32 n=1 Tax=Halobacteriovorax sp. HLS TaxID=2234000 RepID=UPI000FD9F709|nr:RNA polymerase factor sigma-32 [Halobacteriovorax sp. HLS]
MNDSKKNSTGDKKVLSPEILDRELEQAQQKALDDIEIVVDHSDQENLDDILLPILAPSRELDTYKSGPNDPLSLYLKEIAQYDLLTIEEEKELTQKLVETGDIEIAKKLVTANLRLVVKIAMEYKSAFQNVMDLIQEGNVGLMKAVSKYDPDKGAKLSYYSSWWIRSYILKYILDNFRLVKIGTTNEQKKLFYNLLKEKDRLAKLGIEPDAKRISENLGVSQKAVTLMDKRLSSSGGEVSLDTPLSDDSGASRLSDILEDDSAQDISEQISDAQSLEILQNNLKDFVSGLKQRDQEIFKNRLLSEVPLSLQAIADQYGVSRERIRQIEERLLKNLKVYMSEFIR